MLFLNNIFKSVVDKFTNFYNNLTDDSKFAFFVIIVLIIIVAILVIMLIDQIRQSKKTKKKPVEVPKKEVHDDIIFEDATIDEENEKTRNLKEITDKLKEVIDNRNVDINKFEQEQEEASIISYNELLKAVGKDKPVEENQDTFKLPELARKIEADEIIEEETPRIESAKESRFRTSDFISPIFGIQDKGIMKEAMASRMEQPQPRMEEEPIIFNEEKEDAFLNNLKDLRNNLN